MEEKLEWKKKKNIKSEMIEDLKKQMSCFVLNEINDINSKIESLCRMGVIKDGLEIQKIREKMKQLKNETII
jgi:hypothetical protein